jgi:hypothetical protein
MTLTDLQVDYVINNFDFEKVYKVMSFLEWHWYPHERPPTQGEMRELAERLLYEAVKEKTSVATGGFAASYFPDAQMLTLTFTVEGVTVYEDSEN